MFFVVSSEANAINENKFSMLLVFCESFVKNFKAVPLGGFNFILVEINKFIL